MSEMVSRVGPSNGRVTTTSPAEVARRFLELLQDRELDRAADLLSDDVRYINVSLPTIRGRDRTMRALRLFMSGPGGFEVYFHSVSADGPVVLTERTDVLIYGRLRIQIWVCGRFDVEDGRITQWKDYFDWSNFALAAVRGLIGALVPALRPKPPVVA